MNYKEYYKTLKDRQEIISDNRSRRMRGLDSLVVPELPECPKWPVAYEKDGTFVGRLYKESECPKGCVVKWEPMKYHDNRY